MSSDILQKKPSMILKMDRISGFLPALFLIYPSVCRGCNFSWKVEQESGFYACRMHSSEWWLREVRSEAITTEEGNSQGSKSHCEAALIFVLLIIKVPHTNEMNQHCLFQVVFFFLVNSIFYLAADVMSAFIYLFLTINYFWAITIVLLLLI